MGLGHLRSGLGLMGWVKTMLGISSECFNKNLEILKIRFFTRCVMENDTLKRDRAKLEDDNKSYKAEVDALKQKLHAAEQENRKLAHDREKLARAFKDSDTAKVRAETRVKELEARLAPPEASPPRMTSRNFPHLYCSAPTATSPPKKHFLHYLHCGGRSYYRAISL